MRSYKRKAPTRELQDKVLILCGGNTEEVYFNHYKRQYKDQLSNVKVKITSCKYSNPLGIVNEAVTLKDKYNEIWCVFDKDDFSDFDEAIKRTNNYNNIFCAFSNEAIEYWFVLYFSDKRGSISRKKLNEMISKQFNVQYDKSNSVIEYVCNKLEKMDIGVAEECARRGYEYHKLNSGKKFSEWRSCTSVFMLTKRLRQWKDAN